MLRKRSNSKTNIGEIKINASGSNEIKHKKSAPKVIKDSVETKKPDTFATRSVSMVRNSSALFDPDNASPASDFMSLLKLRMSIYYEPEMNIIV